jgi:hypothetical protein
MEEMACKNRNILFHILSARYVILLKEQERREIYMGRKDILLTDIY